MKIDAAIARLRAVWNLALASGPESEVSKTWLLRNPGKLERKFAAAHGYAVSRFGEYLRFEAGNEVFLWPANASESMMVKLLAELLTPFHPHQYRWGPTQVGADDIVLDIGACEGIFAAIVTGRCKGVVAVEPSRSMCKLMREMFRVRRQACPLIKQCLLGTGRSTAYFIEDVLNPGASRITLEPTAGAYEVPVLTLDQLVEEIGIKPTYIKCDAEGAAPMIIAGGRRFLEQNRPKLAIASYHTDGEYVELHNLLKPMGYRIKGKGFIFTGSKLRINMLHAW